MRNVYLMELFKIKTIGYYNIRNKSMIKFGNCSICETTVFYHING